MALHKLSTNPNQDLEGSGLKTNRRKVTFLQFGQNDLCALSARYLSGILRSRGYDVTIICLELSKKQGSGQSWDYGCYAIRDRAIKTLFELAKGSLFIGVTVYSFVANIMREIYGSSYNPERIPFVVGGPHPTLEPYHCSFFSDYVCVGDGERAVVELADKLSRRPFAQPQNPFVPAAENTYLSALLRSVKDQPPLFGREAQMDAQSLPDYSFNSEYFISEQGYIRITPDNAAQHLSTYATFLSRGCVNDCSFCAHEMIAQRSGFQKRIKTKEVPHFINELGAIKINYPWVKTVALFDPNILSNRRDSLENILDYYRKNVRLPLWVTGFTFNQADERIYRIFLTAGMNYVVFGIESGADRTRKLFNRRETKDQILYVDGLNHRLKKQFYFNVQYDIIADCPWESPDDVKKNILFISLLKGYDYLDIFSLRFLPGTPLFQKALDDGILKPEDAGSQNQKVYRALNHTYENFLLLLIRDNFLRSRMSFNIALHPQVAGPMAWLFRRHGTGIFRAYASGPVLRFVSFRRKIGRACALIKVAGIRKAYKILNEKIRRKYP